MVVADLVSFFLVFSAGCQIKALPPPSLSLRVDEGGGTTERWGEEEEEEEGPWAERRLRLFPERGA